MKQKEKLLIFDFDGTIADTKSIYYKSIYDVVKRFGYSYKDIDRIIDLGMSLRKVLKKLGFSFLTSWFLHKEIMNNVEKYVNEVKKCKDVDSINGIRTKKILVTNSLKEFVTPILRHLKINCFNEIYGAEDFADKAEFIKEYLKKRKLSRRNCYYVGDRASDVITAGMSGCKSIIVSGKCAWDSKKEISKANPDFIVSDIKDIRKIAK
ncbi:MAG: HAD hydrolase-like protein [Candidatus Nanoarchaeia archaeon]|nr:HAD hydrolase-like protein [Candidatus Nanoarchaeia archaeon]MDD5740778.1 HAD hydrolase-like protein [Candidatus Nanoarchaeia archaeon]